jgi:HSP20 family protein
VVENHLGHRGLGGEPKERQLPAEPIPPAQEPPRRQEGHFDDVFNFQRDVDRLFNQFWSDLPTRTAAGSSAAFHVNTTDDGWRVDIPLPGIDPNDVSLEVAGHTLTIRTEVPRDGGDKNVSRYEQTLMIPQFLDLEKLHASHRHGMLRLTLPLKESVKPRRVQIETQGEDQKQLVGAR